MKINSTIILLLAGIVLSFNACKKGDTEQGKMDFKFIAANDTTIVRGGSVDRLLQLFYLGGKIENVAFSDSGLPSGVSITYNPTSLKPDGYVHQIFNVSSTATLGTFIVKVTGTSETGNTFSRYYNLTITPIPNAKPRIILTGSGNLIHSLNSPWTEPGYAATDLEDGNLTTQVITGGSVNPDSVGIYHLTYKVTDSAGNSDSIVRTVTVQNDVNYLNGQFSVITTDLSNGSTRNWITSFSTSLNTNNLFTIFKISDCYQANPLTVYSPTKDSILIAPQTFICIRPTDTLSHTFSGSGKIVRTTVGSTPVTTVTLFYSDSYFDPGSSSNVTIPKKDVYVMQ